MDVNQIKIQVIVDEQFTHYRFLKLFTFNLKSASWLSAMLNTARAQALVNCLPSISLFTPRGWFHKSWVHGANHTESNIHIHSTPMPNFWEGFCWRKSVLQGAKDWPRVQFFYEIDPGLTGHLVCQSSTTSILFSCNFLSLVFNNPTSCLIFSVCDGKRWKNLF